MQEYSIKRLKTEIAINSHTMVAKGEEEGKKNIKDARKRERKDND